MHHKENIKNHYLAEKLMLNNPYPISEVLEEQPIYSQDEEKEKR